MAFFGLKPEQAGWGAVEIWPDNLQVFEFFMGLGTQWRVGMSGPTGLDYTAVRGELREWRITDTASGRTRRLTADERSDWFIELQVMEAAALSVMHKKDSDG